MEHTRVFLLTAGAVVAAALSACGHAADRQPCVATGPAPAAVAPSAPPAAPATGGGRRATQAPVDPSQIVAVVDDCVITVGDVQDRINRQSPFIRSRYAAPDKLKEFLDSLIRFQLMALGRNSAATTRIPRSCA